MGRSVPPWRTRVEDEIQEFLPYRRALSAQDQVALDALFDAVRQRRAAGGLLPSRPPWRPMVLSMLVDLMVQVRDLNERVQRLEEDLREH
jgi:hypothetical protein